MSQTPKESLPMSAGQTGDTLRKLRVAKGLSLRQLAGQTFADHSWIANVEAGRRWPKDRGWIERADIELGAGGVLVSAWDADQRRVAETARISRLLDQARKESQSLLTAPDGADLDTIQASILGLSKDARFEPYEQTLQHACDLRAELARRLRQQAFRRPEEIRELFIALGRVCGVLSYITLDLGQGDTARVHAEAAFTLADRAEHDGLRAWSKGTEALALRFAKNFEGARDVALEGLQYAGASTGTARPRLLCSLAASTSNLGDSASAIELLDSAERARDASQPDEIPGLFSFSRAKQTYYHGFTLMWGEKPKTLKQSVRASEDAIEAWQQQRSPGDEMLSQIYLATANARLGELDASMAAIAPVLELPITAHFSWVRKRLSQLDSLLGENFPDSGTAADAKTTLQAYVHSA